MIRLLLVLAVACAGPAPAPVRPAPPAPSCVCPAPDETVTAAILERDQCAERLAHSPSGLRRRTVEVTIPGPPRICGGAGPPIVPVDSMRTKGGMWLDDRAVAALAANELAWRAWVAKVQKCEAGK